MMAQAPVITMRVQVRWGPMLRLLMSRATEYLKRAAAQTWKQAWKNRAEAAFGFALLAGWALVTWPIATLLSPLVWPFSAGIALLLLVCGWRMLWTIASHGLYSLSKGDGK